MNDQKIVGLNAKGKEEMFPQVWMNKNNGLLFVVVPWMEVFGNDMLSTMSAGPGTRCVVGVLSQVGWLIENEHGVHFGVNLRVEKAFKKLGEL